MLKTAPRFVFCARLEIILRRTLRFGAGVCVQKKSKSDKTEVDISALELSPIAHPLAQKKLLKKLHKTLRKGVWECSLRG